MLFGFQQVSTIATSVESSSELYVATDMSPIECAIPTEELRTAIKHSSPQVQALFEQAMRRCASDSK